MCKKKKASRCGNRKVVKRDLRVLGLLQEEAGGHARTEQQERCVELNDEVIQDRQTKS